MRPVVWSQVPGPLQTGRVAIGVALRGSSIVHVEYMRVVRGSVKLRVIPLPLRSRGRITCLLSLCCVYLYVWCDVHGCVGCCQLRVESPHCQASVCDVHRDINGTALRS